MALDWGTLIGQVGVPSFIAIFLVYYIAVEFRKALKQVGDNHKLGMESVSKAISNQTRVLNHTLTEQMRLIRFGLENQTSKKDLRKLQAYINKKR